MKRQLARRHNAMGFSSEAWVTIIVALLSGGFFKFVFDTYKDFRDRPSKEVREVSMVGQSIETVVRARDELEEDNRRIRTTFAEERKQWGEERARYEADRIAWRTERANLLAEIHDLEHRIRVEQARASKEYDDLLRQIHQLQKQHQNEGQ